MDALTLLEENKQLKRLIKGLFKDVASYGNGCGCCETTNVIQHPNYKLLEELLKQDVELPTTGEVVERLTT